MRLSRPTSALLAAASLLVSAASSCAEEARQLLNAPFLCTAGQPLPNLAKTTERTLHEFKGLTEKQYDVCALVEQFQILRQGPAPLKKECQTFKLVTFTVMCRGGAVSAARWWAASEQGQRSGFRIDGDTLSAPFEGGGGWNVSPSGPGITGMRTTSRSRSYAALPAGYGFSLNLPVSSLSNLEWDAAGTLKIPVTGSAEPTIAAARPAAPWVRTLAAWYPWPQLVLGLPLLAYSIIAFVGLRVGEASPSQRTRLVGCTAIALVCLALTYLPAGLPDGATRAARAQLEQGRALMREIDRDRAELARIVRLSPATGMLEPIAMSDARRLTELTRPRVIPTVRTPAVNPSLWATLSLMPALAVVLAYLPAFLRGRHYLVVKHPAEPHVLPAIKEQRPVHGRDLAGALKPDASDTMTPPVWWHSDNLRRKAAALADKLKADTEVAKAAREHASAMAALKDAERQLKEAKRKRDSR